MKLLRKTTFSVLRPIACAILICLLSVISSNSWATPQNISFQSRIYKPDGTPLETAGVQFKFSLMNPLSTCVIYSETFSSVDMTGSSGSIVLALGAGTRSYPVAGGMTWLDAFNNATASYTCQSSGTFSPAITDVRRLVMQFNDGSGWQTLPPMDINSVPYSMFAQSAESIPLTGIPQGGATAGQVLKWNGTSWAASTDDTAGGGAVISTSSANAYLTITNPNTTPSFAVNVGTGTNTLAAGDDSRIVGAFQAATALSGDLTGTLPNPTIKSGAITDAKITSVAWGKVTATPTTIAGYNISDALSTSSVHSGDVTGTYNTLALNTIGAGGSGYKITYDTKGRVTGATGLVSADITAALGFAPGASQWVTNASNDISYSTGYVGIGTTTPTEQLEIVGSGNINLRTSTDVDHRILLSNAVANKAWSMYQLASNNADAPNGLYYEYFDGSTVSGKMVLTASGDVGIGTKTPQNPLHVEKNFDAEAAILIKNTTNGAGATASLVAQAAGSGYAQFGMGSPTVAAAGGLYADRALVYSQTTNGMVLATEYSTPIVFATNAVEQMRIMGSGRVGIGVINPGYALDVSGDVNVTGHFKVNGVNIGGGSSGMSSDLTSANIFVGNASNVAQGQVLSGDATLSNLGILTFNSSSTTRGHLGLGTSAVYNVPVTGDAAVGEVVKGDDSRLINSRAPAGVASGDLSGTYPNPALAVVGAGGTGTKITYDTKGRVTGASALVATDIPSLDATKVTSGVFDTARLGTGSADVTTFLRGDGSWQTAGGGGLPTNSLVTYTARVATTANITLSGTQTIDGVALSIGDRVLVRSQSVQSANGVYVVAAGAWTRATDMDTWTKVKGHMVHILEGSVWNNMKFATSVTPSGVLDSNTIAFVAMGSSAGDTAFGYDALGKAGSIGNNTAFGMSALSFAANPGTHNTAVGNRAMASNSGSQSTGVGSYALSVNTSGANNTAVGSGALSSNGTASDNTAIGTSALSPHNSGDGNVAIGSNAGMYQADGLTNLTTSTNSIYLGTNTKGNAAVDNNSIVIGYNATSLGANTVVLGNSSIATTALRGNVGIGTTAPSSKLEVSGDLTVSHIVGRTATPSIAAGPAAGTGPTVSISGTDMGSIITLTTGTSPGADAVAVTVTFANAYSSAPVCVFSPANAEAASFVVMTYMQTSTTSYSLNTGLGSTLTDSTQYKWSVICVQ